jgi:hypothetical protein
VPALVAVGFEDIANEQSKYIPILETIGGLVVPLVLAGPWVLMGLGVVL